jgi:hypothetical protein
VDLYPGSGVVTSLSGNGHGGLIMASSCTAARGHQPGALARVGVCAIIRVARWTAGAAHLPDVSGQAAGVGQGPAEQELDLGVGAAQFVAGPPGQRVVHGRVEAQQDALAFGHYWYKEPVFTTC